MNSFKAWYCTHRVEITWFIIGWLMLSGMQSAISGQYINALFDFGFAFLNYVFYKK